MESSRYDYLDSLRGIGVLCVVMVHTGQYGRFNVPGLVSYFVSQGEKGVQLFYLVSAFTLFLSMKNRFTRELNPIGNFFIRRFFRVAPMYYIAIAVYLSVYGFGPRYWLGDVQNISVLNILSNITFLHGFNPYWINSVVPGGWSIGVEMTFYCILPLLFSKIKTINHAVNCFAVSIFVRTILYQLLSRFNPIGSDYLWSNYLFLYIPSQFPVFCLGIIMYFILIEKQSFFDISYKTLFVLSLCRLVDLFTGRGYFWAGHIIFALVFLLFAMSISKYKNRIAVNPVFSYLGKISFSMYLVHFGVLIFLTKINFIDFAENGIINFVIRFIIVVGLSAAISTISYNVIEQPFQKIGKKIIDKIEERISIERKASSV